MQNVSRRKVLLGTAASLLLPITATPLFESSARADGGVTAVMAVLALASAAASLSGGAGGLGDILQSLQVSINAVLEIQRRTLEAIVLVNKNIEELKTLIPNLFNEQHYWDAYKSSFKVYEAAKTFNFEIRD